MVLRKARNLQLMSFSRSTRTKRDLWYAFFFEIRHAEKSFIPSLMCLFFNAKSDMYKSFHPKIQCVVFFHFKVWHAVKDSYQNLTGCVFLLENLTCGKFFVQNLTRCVFYFQNLTRRLFQRKIWRVVSPYSKCNCNALYFSSVQNLTSCNIFI